MFFIYFFYHYSINYIFFSIIHKEAHTVFPRIEARASISFRQVFTPASKQDRPLIEAGVYFLLFVEAFVDLQFFEQIQWQLVDDRE